MHIFDMQNMMCITHIVGCSLMQVYRPVFFVCFCTFFIFFFLLEFMLCAMVIMCDKRLLLLLLNHSLVKNTMVFHFCQLVLLESLLD